MPTDDYNNGGAYGDSTGVALQDQAVEDPYNNGAIPDPRNFQPDTGGLPQAIQRNVSLYALLQTCDIQQFSSRAAMAVDEEVAEEVAYNADGAPGMNVGMARMSDPLPVVRPPPLLRPLPPIPRPPQAPHAENIKGAYTLERQDHKHRMGDVLKAIHLHLYNRHLSMPQPGMPPAYDNVMFYDYLDSLNEIQVRELLKKTQNPQDRPDLREKAQRYSDNNAVAFMKGVQYLSYTDRKDYKVRTTETGLLTWHGQALDTSGLETMFSGEGWGIWVMTPLVGKKTPKTNRFYTNSHKLGSFHHSSFLAGDDVQAAGEWKVTDGVVQEISSKTGHYKCSLPSLKYALYVLKKRGAKLDNAQVRVYDLGAARLLPFKQFMKDDLRNYAAFG